MVKTKIAAKYQATVNNDYLELLDATLSEWATKQDDEAFNDLQDLDRIKILFSGRSKNNANLS